MEPEVVYNAILNGYAGSKVLDGKLTAAMDREFKAGFRLDLHIKDMVNAVETGYAVAPPCSWAYRAGHDEIPVCKRSRQ